MKPLGAGHRLDQLLTIADMFIPFSCRMSLSSWLPFHRVSNVFVGNKPLTHSAVSLQRGLVFGVLFAHKRQLVEACNFVVVVVVVVVARLEAQ